MLIFARDASGSNSLAFDFGKKELKAGKQYPVRIDLGVLTRNLIGIAAANDVLIAQLGRDEPFYNMLVRKAEMRVVIDGHETYYGLEGIDDALEALNNCAMARAENKKFEQREIPLKQTAEDASQTSSTVGAYDTNAANDTGTKAKTDNIVRQSLENSLQEEIEILRAQNRKLLLENQRMTSKTVISVTQTPKPAPLSNNEGPRVEAVPVEPVELQADPLPALPDMKTVSYVPQKAMDILEANGMTPERTKSGYYIWQTGAVTGRLQTFKMGKGEKLEDAANRYMLAAKTICDGDYAFKLTADKEEASGLATAESACMGAADNTGTGLIMLGGNKGEMTVIALQGPTDNMQDTLDIREALTKALSKKEIKPGKK